MRKAPERKPDLPGLQALVKQAFEADILSLDVELITPLFGGGVQAKKVDEVCWLRGSEVKASLRFWWRALFGHAYGTSQDLHAAESKRFGSAKGNEGESSQVAVFVKETKPIETRSLNLPPGDARAGTYFPGLPGQGNNEIVLFGQPGARANLSLRFSPSLPTSIRQEVLQALTAFLLFGGVGSRTRRAGGALAPTDPHQARAIGYPVTEGDLDEWLSRLGTGDVAVSGTYFSLRRKGILLRTSQSGSPDQAHQALLEHWRAFRQNRRHPANWQGRGPWGQSRWPEGDVVRRFVRKNFSQHTPDAVHVDQAPRALLGLPIVIHFKEQLGQEHHQIMHRESDRYASPIWLGVARVWNGSSPVHHGVVAAMPSVLPFPPILEVKGRVDKLVLKATYPTSRKDHPEEPPPWVVADAADMVKKVASAFTHPSNHPVREPHFITRNV